MLELPDVKKKSIKVLKPAFDEPFATAGFWIHGIFISNDVLSLLFNDRDQLSYDDGFVLRNTSRN